MATAKELVARFKQAAMVLMGHRPAEVRFDERDKDIAEQIGRGWARTFAGGYPELEGTYPEMIDDATEMFFFAIQDYATGEFESRKQQDAEQKRLQKEFGF